MPLPSADTIWPPAQTDTAYRAYSLWDAWYTGDTNQLQTLYSNPGNQGGAGFFGGMRRWFHGTPIPQQQTQPPVKLHLGIPAEIARTSAALLFAEMFTVKFEDDDEDADDLPADGTPKPDPHKDLNGRVEDLLDDDAHARLIEGGEYASAHGGVFLKATWDKAVKDDGPFITVATADSAVPEFRYGRLTAVTFWTRLAPVNAREYLLLERHEPGSIEYGLYQSAEKGRLGHLVPLAEHPDAAGLAAAVDENAQILTGSTLLSAVYVPNVKPNRKWRKDPHARNLGRSDFDGVEDVFDAADELFTSYMREFRLAKARITVPKGALTVGKPGQGATWNADQEVYVELGETVGSLNPAGGAGAAEGAKLELFQPLIREKEHREAIGQLKEWAVEEAGYSPQTFGSAGDVAMTATESIGREKATILSRSAKILAARPALVHLIAVLIDIDAHVFAGPGRGDLMPTIEFPDAASDAPKVVADMLAALNTSESASIQTRVEMLHPDWDDAQVLAEVQRIRDDYSMLPMPDEKNLWAAVASNGSSSGGVALKQGQVAPGDPSLATAAADAKRMTSQEAKLDGAGGGGSGK